ncbi:25S rRNA (uridine-N(3))-methyltransferase [Colletotrichum plurivorum]|uniref:25S rRNA (Uridine-N(3))-methyltransferase n=1 Tax=Colletotrichum plurivorum TaxID=2175906 RepID=A0A8H6KVU7_9PEZI|nr:25S rRNA (uridine-N(3))-methyltransferase [Colletotrichum plurivorum]
MGKKRKHQNHFVDSANAKKKTRPNPGPAPGGGPSRAKGKGGAGAADGAKKKEQKQYHQNQQPVIPFKPEDTILLVGEGDLSFAASLAAHHGCRNVTATVLEKNEKELLEKYPHASENIAKITGAAAPSKPTKPAKDDEEEDGDASEPEEDDAPDPADDEDEDEEEKYKPTLPNNNKILYNIDARTMKPFTKRTTTQNHHGNSTTTKHGVFKRIIFNFPHVGGKSTDRNRQVRYNQELLVAFFNSALPSLAPGGTVIVTLFEGDPYTLWNVKDLGRHAGFQALESFRFHSKAYPGYRHARTLGVVRDKRSGEASGAAWKGEERPARTYLFMRKGEAPEPLSVQKKKKRRGGEESSSDEEEEEESEVELYDD